MVADLSEVCDALREVLNRKSMTCLTNWDVMNAVSQAFMTANRAHVASQHHPARPPAESDAVWAVEQLGRNRVSLARSPSERRVRRAPQWKDWLP